MLLIGMPNADSSFYEMNIAQLPQGPRLNILEHVLKLSKMPRQLRRKIRMSIALENIFNPKRKTPYMGMRLIEQNLRDILNITLIEYPKSEMWIVRYLKKNLDIDIVGFGIGCENRVFHAKRLAKKIKKVRPDIKIIFGSYGATSGKKLGMLTPEDGTVLWDSEEERKEKKEKGKDFYKGEGVHDIRLWLREQLGIDAGDPNAPLISEAVSDSDTALKGRISKWLKGVTGFVTMPKDSHKLVSAIGCSNKCDFCSTSKIFNREKTYLYKNAKKIFAPMEKVYDMNFSRDDYPPEANFFVMDENFMKDEKVKAPTGVINFIDVAEELCSWIEQSKKNIHFGTFSDMRSLLRVRKKYGDFRKLVQGGITSIWIGLESREDVFGKRGGASPDTVKNIVDELQSLGIVVIGSFILGLPYHTEGDTKIIVDEDKVRSLIRKNDKLTDDEVEQILAQTREVKKKSGKYDLLNIWEDFQWWKSLETGARQVMTHSITGTVGGHSHMFRFSDYDFGHKMVPGHSFSKINGDRLTEIDETLRERFYIANGPVALSSILVMWKGFMNLKDSDNEPEVRSATFNYWMVKRNIRRLHLASIFFNETIFTKCSDRFLHRLATMFKEVEEYSPPDTEINRKYQSVFKLYDCKNSKFSKTLANKMSANFIKSHL